MPWLIDVPEDVRAERVYRNLGHRYSRCFCHSREEYMPESSSESEGLLWMGGRHSHWNFRAFPSPFGADAPFQFNAKAPRWLNPLRSTIWLPARLLMPRSLFTARSVQECWSRFTSNASPVSGRRVKSRSRGRSRCRFFAATNGSGWGAGWTYRRRVGRRGGHG